MRSQLVKAFVFDFDGLILDTEEPVYRSWLEVYQAHGEELPYDRWIEIVGSSTQAFDPKRFLEERLGRELTQDVLDGRIERRTAMVLAQPILPGVAELATAARDAGLRVGVASSSTSQWVKGHLERLGILDRFDCVRCRDDVVNVKPSPDLYRAVAVCLGVEPQEAVAIEDSPNGITAAKAAGMWCVAVPNGITGGLDLSHADVVLATLEAVTPPDLVRKIGLTLWGHENRDPHGRR
ncbi:MAG TPA: HAD family hydrolase [Candidatus Dormibacteraeota bacterium]|nr:HAD family hydrolase [Candidatus Dormibacteraeota bacterium]